MPDHKKELEEFAYIVSHDLNAPLRHIREFGKLLFKRLGDKVDEEEREYLHYMESSVDKMESMISALLEYSRLNTQRDAAEAFSPADLLEETLSLLSEKMKETGATINHRDLPQNITADKNQFRQLLFKLIDNAIKFHKADTAPVIDVSATETNEHWQFCIADNGIGLDSAQHERMFAMFKRLNVSEDQDGIGSGLPIAQKIVVHHGGEIWFDSELDQGAKIYFTLAKF